MTSSRPSLTGLSRPPQPTSAPLTGAQLVWQRYAFLGAAAALLLSGLTLVPVRGFPQAWSGLLLSIIFSAVLAGLGLSAWGCLVSAVAPKSVHLRRGAAFGGATLLAVYLVTRGLGEVFRLNAGQTLNLGVFEFALEGASHLVVPLLGEYPSEVALLLMFVSLGALCAYRVFNRPTTGEPRRSALLLRGGASLVGLMVSLHLLASPGFAQQSHVGSTAELALLASLAQREQEEASLEVLPESAALVQRAPKREAAELWEKGAPLMVQRTPNVVIIQLESVGVNHLGYSGYARPTTPRIDALASKSLRFRQARSTATHSNYAQMAVLSSLFPRRYAGLDTYHRLDYPRVLWHDVLRHLHYQTATYSSQDESWQGMLRFESTDPEHPILHAGNYEGKKVVMGSERTVPDEITAARAARFIESQKGPFGVYINFQATHFPYVVPPTHQRQFLPDKPTKGKYHYLKYSAADRKTVINRYDNALRHVDAQVGRILDAIQRRGIAENTIVILTADHGEMFGEHDVVTHGRTLFEQEARVPLLISFPGYLEPADELQAVSTLDVMPTLLGLLGLAPHPAYQGRDLLAEDAKQRAPAIFLNIQGMRCREGVLCGDYKYARDPQGQNAVLFDLSRDPAEARNLIKSEPRVAAQLDALLKRQMSAQMLYHARDQQTLRDNYFAPRLEECPRLEPLADEQELSLSP